MKGWGLLVLQCTLRWFILEIIMRDSFIKFPLPEPYRLRCRCSRAPSCSHQ
jgi:hypothetical protein